MKTYLGETPLKIEDSPFKDFTPEKWALHFIQLYGGIDGSHHKDWVLDRVVRVLNGCVPRLFLAKWSDGTEHVRFYIDDEDLTEEYLEWVRKCKDGEDGPDTYSYEVGVAP